MSSLIEQPWTGLLREESFPSQHRDAFRKLFDNARDAIFIVGEDGRLLYVNGEGCRQRGLACEDMLGRPVSRFETPPGATLTPALLERIRNEGRAVFETSFAASDGRIVPLEVSAWTIVYDGDPAVMAICRDITQRKEAARQQRFMQFSMEKAADSVLWIDRDARLVYVNEAACRILGYPREELLGMTVFDIDPGRTTAEWREHWERLRAHGSFVFESRHRTRAGRTFPVEITVNHLAFEGEEYDCAFVRDISERQEMETLLRQSQKMEAVGQLAGGIAHDFNNLLQAIQGYIELALHGLEPRHPAADDLHEAEKATGRAVSLVRRLLTFSRRETMKPERLDLNVLVRGTLGLLERVLGAHVTVRLAPGSGLDAIYADASQIEQILVNLCTNARDAMPDGGRIDIETRNVLVDRAFTSLHPWAREGRYVLLAVTDEGEGMPPEIRDRIFEPFFTTKAPGSGTGLGLSNVYALTKRHEGFIDVVSEPGAGCSFGIYLPAETSDDGEDRAARPVPREGTADGTILLAEDDELVRELATRILRQAGFRVLAARDGEEAIALFRERADEFDLVVLDVVMPRMTGQAAAAAMRGIAPDLPVLFTSGYSSDLVAADLEPAGRSRLLRKPYTGRDLLDEVSRMLPAHAPA